MNNTKKFAFLCLLSGLFIFSAVFGKNVPIGQARLVAKNFFTSQKMDAWKGNAFIISKEAEIQEAGLTVFYVFNLENDKGFILVSADDRITPVLGYSGKGNFGKKSFPPQFEDLMATYRRQILAAMKSAAPVPAEMVDQWKRYLNENQPVAKSTLNVGPLVTTTWDQGQYYNDSCPADPNAWLNGHVPTGCVATCIAQIMRYHSYPATGSGSHTYTHPDYGPLSANFGATTYNWSAMPDMLWDPNPAIAQLMYHCGVGLEMNYGPYASGAPSSNAALALIHYFNYSNTAQLVQRENYTDPDWISLLKNELDNSRVCYYAGYGSEGHAFVLDGYDENDFFHFNWGWSGYYDGFFDVNNLNPGGGEFNNYQEAIIGIQPGVQAACSGLTTLTAPDGSFSDGSYGGSYTNNSSCQWLIQPANSPAFLELSFMTFNTEDGNDVVNIYDVSAGAPLLGSFSGSSLPPVITSTGPSLFVEFLTNGSITQSGWSAVYETKYCFPTQTLTASFGTFGDGSGFYTYRNNTNCQWLISQPAQTTIILVVNSFDTEYSFDYLDVFDGAGLSDPQIGHFSGDTLPPVLFSTGNNMLVDSRGFLHSFRTCLPESGR
ncbi:MAG: C10 family peptidase [Bacteroidetes bacterium]|nr:C10 family peptidase [Bacteroidota bacterium]